jgi:outer membrane lipoprotein-sorting protein
MKSTNFVFRALAVIAVFVFTAGLVFADEQAADRDAVKKIFDNVKTIEAKFDIIQVSSISNDEKKSNGKFYFQKPNRIKCEYIDPADSGFLVDGKRIVEWKKGKDEKKIVSDMSKSTRARKFMKPIFMFVSMDINEMERVYNISYTQDKITLTRKTKSGARSNAIIEIFYKPSGAINKITFSHKNGASAVINFTNVKINEALPADAFSI